MLHSAPFNRILMELTAITSAVEMMMNDEHQRCIPVVFACNHANRCATTVPFTSVVPIFHKLQYVGVTTCATTTNNAVC